MYSIGQVAEMFGLPISTLRYYDKQGLFPNMERSSGIRRFSDQEIEALRVIECLKKAGMEIQDIRQFILDIDLPCVAIVFYVLLQCLNLNHSFLCGLDRIRKRIEPGRQIFNMSGQIVVVAQPFFFQQNDGSSSFFSIELLRPLFITDRLTLGYLCLNINQHLEPLRGRSLGRAAF